MQQAGERQTVRHGDVKMRKVRWEEMLPDRWAAQHPEAVLTHRLEESRNKAATKKDRRKRRRVRDSKRRR